MTMGRARFRNRPRPRLGLRLGVDLWTMIGLGVG
jgi:hypothetical protein